MDDLPYIIEHFIKRTLFFCVLIATIVVCIPAAIVLSQKHSFEKPIYSYSKPVSSIKRFKTTTPSHLISLGWSVGENLQLNNYNDLNVVSPQFATIGSTDQIQLNSSFSTISMIHNEGKRVWGRVALDSQSDASTHQFLTNPNGNQQVIQSLTTDAVQNHLDGLNLDIEQIQPTDYTGFTQFIKNLSVATQQYYLALSVDLQPEPMDSPSNLHSFNQQIGKYSDYVIFMGYDEHWSADTTPGPVTSLQWLENNINQLIQTGIPSQKLLLGLPSYSRIWKVNQNGETINSEALANEYVNNLMQEEHNHETWDPQQADYYTSYHKYGNTYKVWLTNNRSLEDYLDLLTKYHLGGMGFWNLDMMSSTDWNQLISQFNSSHTSKFN